MRAMATGYTCGASGCHSSSQFAVNKNGYAEARAGNPSDSTTLNSHFTGHITNTPSGCGPCHGVSGTTMSSPAGTTTVLTAENKCASCHDMMGRATNSSAFPHGNRGIYVYEMNAAGATSVVQQLSGNLWMYAGDATYRLPDGTPTATPSYLNQSRTVIDDAAGFHDGHAGKILDGTCLKCHGETYWPTHGMQETGSHGGSSAIQFSDN